MLLCYALLPVFTVCVLVLSYGLVWAPLWVLGASPGDAGSSLVPMLCLTLPRRLPWAVSVHGVRDYCHN